MRWADEKKGFSSARSGRVRTVIYAPPLLIFAVFGISIFVQIPAGYIIHHVSFSLGMLINQVGTLLLPVLIVIRLFGLSGKEVVPFKKVSLGQVLIAALMMCSLAVITDYLLYVTEWAFPVAESLEVKYRALMKVDGVGSYIYKLAFLCLLPSFCEEVFFRGFCQTGLTKSYGAVGGIFVTAAMFSLAHLSPWYMHLYFILGLFLGWLFATSGSVWIPIICHVINNFWTFTTHTVGWKLPVEGAGAWKNVPVLAVAALVLSVTIYGWRRLVNSKS